VGVSGDVEVGDALWLAATTPRTFCDGWIELASPDSQHTTNGTDAIGMYTEASRTYDAAGVVLTVKTYGNNTFVLEQRLVRSTFALFFPTPFSVMLLEDQSSRMMTMPTICKRYLLHANM
jgi:hypothetical protein